MPFDCSSSCSLLFYYFFSKRVKHSGWAIKSNRIAMNRNWSNQKANPALKTKEGNK